MRQWGDAHPQTGPDLVIWTLHVGRQSVAMYMALSELSVRQGHRDAVQMYRRERWRARRVVT